MNAVPPTIVIIIKCDDRQKTFNIEVEPDTRVSELVDELENVVQINENQEINLYLEQTNQRLNRNETLRGQKVGKGFVLLAKVEPKLVHQPVSQLTALSRQQLEQKRVPAREMNLTILNTQNQKTYNITVNPDDKPQDLIDKMKERSIINQREKAVFTHHSQVLNPGLSFRDQNVTENDQLGMNLVRDGGSSF